LTFRSSSPGNTTAFVQRPIRFDVKMTGDGCTALPQPPATFTLVFSYCAGPELKVQTQNEPNDCTEPATFSSPRQMFGSVPQSFQRRASATDGPTGTGVVTGSTTNPAPGPTNVNVRVGWNPAPGAGRGENPPVGWWNVSQSWFSAQAAVHALVPQSNA